jgi:DNA-binding LytR/AlgR family response regulator
LPTVSFLVQCGPLPAIQIGGRWRIKKLSSALAALDKQHFDLLFLDLNLPDGPAEDVYDPAKKTDPELPIIIITGYPDSEILDRILEKGPITVSKNRCKWTSCTRPCGFSAQRNRESGVTRSRFC